MYSSKLAAILALSIAPATCDMTVDIAPPTGGHCDVAVPVLDLKEAYQRIKGVSVENAILFWAGRVPSASVHVVCPKDRMSFLKSNQSSQSPDQQRLTHGIVNVGRNGESAIIPHAGIFSLHRPCEPKRVL
jgi:hypothetical protein